MKSRSEDGIIFQLVSCTFLHFQSTVSTEPNSKIQESDCGGREKSRKRTDPQSASCVWLHDLTHVVRELGKRVSNLPMLNHKALWSIVRGSRQGLDVRTVFSFASHLYQCVEKGEPGTHKLEFFRSLWIQPERVILPLRHA